MLAQLMHSFTVYYCCRGISVSHGCNGQLSQPLRKSAAGPCHPRRGAGPGAEHSPLYKSYRVLIKNTQSPLARQYPSAQCAAVEPFRGTGK